MSNPDTMANYLIRASVPEMDEMLNKKIEVLDHGFIRVVDYMGSDASIVQAARVSYGIGTKTKQEDVGLINYLVRHNHTSPLEMCELKLHIKMPMFVARQWVRHRTASLNELSARYSVLKNDYFIPDINEVRRQSKRNKQGRGEKIEEDLSMDIIRNIQTVSKGAFDTYNELLSKDLSRELARTILPVSAYTEMYWKMDLHNLFHFLRLRMAHSAQKEIAVYAEAILHQIVKVWVPMSYNAFINYKTQSETFSGIQKQDLFRMLNKDAVNDYIEKNSNEKGERRELVELLKKVQEENFYEPRNGRIIENETDLEQNDTYDLATILEENLEQNQGIKQKQQ